MSYRNTDEQLEKAVDLMGSDLGPVYHHLWQRFMQLTVPWDFTCSLFLTEDRWKILGSALGNFVGEFHLLLLRDTISGLMRLLDSPESLGKRNLTFWMLSSLVPETIKPTVALELESLKLQTAHLRTVRHKLLAHLDLEHALGLSDELLLPSRLEITEVFKSILRLLNIVESHFEPSKTHIFPMGNDSAFRLLGRLHVVEWLLEKEEEAAISGRNFISFSKVEFLSQFGYFKEERREEERYGRP